MSKYARAWPLIPADVTEFSTHQGQPVW